MVDDSVVVDGVSVVVGDAVVEEAASAVPAPSALVSSELLQPATHRTATAATNTCSEGPICSLRRVGIHHLTHFSIWLSSNSGRVVDLTSIGRWLCPVWVDPTEVSPAISNLDAIGKCVLPVRSGPWYGLADLRTWAGFRCRVTTSMSNVNPGNRWLHPPSTVPLSRLCPILSNSMRKRIPSRDVLRPGCSRGPRIPKWPARTVNQTGERVADGQPWVGCQALRSSS